MKIKGKISLLINQKQTLIELTCENSNIQFAEITLTPKQLNQVLSRVCNVECDIEVHGLDNVGKVIHRKTHEFEMPETEWKMKKEVAGILAKETCPEGWKPSLYFGSKDSFFEKDGKQFARCQINKWT